MAKSRELWKIIMKENHGAETEMWLQYFRLERSYGKHKNCVKLLQDAVNSASDDPELVFKTYIDYCCFEGTLEEYEIAQERCRSQQKRVDERRIKATEKETHNQIKPKSATKKKEFIEKKKDKKPHKNTDKNSEFKIPVPVRNKVFKAPPGFKPPPGFVPPLGFVMPEVSRVEPMDQSEESGTLKRSSNETQDTVIPGKKKTLVGDISETLVAMAGCGDDTLPPCKMVELIDMSVEARKSRTVFVSNLDFKVNEKLLTMVFGKSGEIGEIRLVVNMMGKSKGYAYIEFKQLESVEKALLRDRESISGRPMFISKCKDKEEEGQEKQEPFFKYSQEMEMNKLFIKGLPFSSTKESLQKLFSPFGELNDIRLVTHRSGAFKGLAYVDFKNDASASKAVLSLDGKMIGQHAIVVAISNPPMRKEKTKIASLGAGRTDIHNRGRSHSKVSFTPRSLNTAPAKPHGKDNNGLPKQKMSNSDFRSFLLKK